MNLRWLSIISIYGVLGFCCVAGRATGQTVSHGRQVILNRGLQIQSLVWPTYNGYTGITNLNQWVQANYTTLNFFQTPPDVYDSLLTSGVQWARDSHNYTDFGGRPLTLDANDAPYANSFVGFCYDDETTQTQAVLDEEKADYAAWDAAYPNALSYTNFVRQPNECKSTERVHGIYPARHDHVR